MLPWTAYPAFLATAISIIGLSRIVINNSGQEQPRTLSELATAEQSLLAHFRNILWLCGLLFAVSVFGLIVMQGKSHFFLIIFGALMIGGELYAATVPARGNTLRLHNGLAQIMAIGMLGLVYTFWFDLNGSASVIELVMALTMSILAILTFADRERFVLYELCFIFLSHFSVLLAIIALVKT